METSVQYKNKSHGGALRRGAIRASRGFTLIEMMVAVALFSVVMVVSVSTLLALVGANRKAQALESVMNNLNISLDGMVRAIRMGTSYHCGLGDPNVPANCKEIDSSGHDVFAFQPYGFHSTDPRTIYRFEQDPGTGYGHIAKSVDGGQHYFSITAPEVNIEDMEFYVSGSQSGCTAGACDNEQPKVVIVLKGSAPVPNSRTRAGFHLQVTAVQRQLDI